MDYCSNVPAVEAILLTAWAALGIGLTTSLGHCIGMCGPLVSTFSLAQGRNTGRLNHLLPGLLVYHLGRISAYAVIGLAFGFAASAAQATGPSVAVRGGLFAVAGGVMIVLGLGLAGWLPTTRFLESNKAGRYLAEHFISLVGTRSMAGRYLLGVANGFLPCGPVYAMAVAALTAPTPAHGAGMMTMFGLGTLPVLLAIGLGTGRLAPSLQRRFILVATILVLFVGVEFLLRAGKMFGLIEAIRWGFLPVW